MTTASTTTTDTSPSHHHPPLLHPPSPPLPPPVQLQAPSAPIAGSVVYQQPPYRAPSDRIFYLSHTCQPACLTRIRPSRPDKHRGKNPLLTPLLYDFRRMTGRRKVNRKVGVVRRSGWLPGPGVMWWRRRRGLGLTGPLWCSYRYFKLPSPLSVLFKHMFSFV